jgi:hypothetical protein
MLTWPWQLGCLPTSERSARAGGPGGGVSYLLVDFQCMALNQCDIHQLLVYVWQSTGHIRDDSRRGCARCPVQSRGTLSCQQMCCMLPCRVETSAKPFLPSQADMGVTSLLLWLERYGGGGPPTSSLQDMLGGASPGEVCKGRGMCATSG